MLIRKNYKLYISVFLLLISSTVFAGPRNKFGLSAARELLIPVGSISTAVDGSNLASVKGVDAMYWNPAGLGNISSKMGEVLFSNQRYIADINLNYFAGAYKVPNLGTFGISVKAMDFGEIEVTTTDAPDGTGEFYSPTYINAGLTFARQMTDRILFGATAKLIYEKISRETASGFAFDVGLQYSVSGTGLKFGLALKNLGPSMVFRGEDLEDFYQPAGTSTGTNNEPRSITLADFELPTSLSLGLSYDYALNKTNMVSIHGNFQNNSFSQDDYSFGLEYNYNNLIYLRGGYTFNELSSEDRLFGPTFGAGINYNLSNVRVGFDYAYRVTENFDANQFFTLNVGF